MAKLKLRGNDLIEIGFPQNKAISIAIAAMLKHYKRETKERVQTLLKEVLKDPQRFMGDGVFGKTAEALLSYKKTEPQHWLPIGHRLPFLERTALKPPLKTSCLQRLNYLLAVQVP